MKFLQQRNFYTTVREQGDKLLGETVLQDNGSELVARMLTGRSSFTVEDAALETYGPAGEKNIKIPALVGKEAYLGAGNALKGALAGQSELVSDLFKETVKGIIQAETFLYSERGFASAAEYDEHWNRIYFESCRYYSNLDRVTCQWDEHVGPAGRNRKGLLFVRAKTYSLCGSDDGKYTVTGIFKDSFHEMSAVLNFNGLMAECGGDIVRVPDAVCKEAAVYLPLLAGTDPITVTKKELALLLGGGQGCVHLQDLVYDAVQLFKHHTGKK